MSENGANSVARRLAARRAELGLTLAELAERAGCTKGYLSQIESAGRLPRHDVLRRIEEALSLAPDSLVSLARWEETPPEIRREVVDHRRASQAVARKIADILKKTSVDGEGRIHGSLDQAYHSGELARLVDMITPEPDSQDPPTHATPANPPTKTPANRADRPAFLSALPMEVPLINAVSAGYPREFTDLSYPARVADEYVRCPDLSDPDAFAARVVGDSMLPEYREGDIVVFSPARAVSSGMDCFARLEPHHETTFKRVYMEHDATGAAVIRLQPLNSAFPPRIVPREHVAGLYAAVSVTRAIR